MQIVTTTWWSDALGREKRLTVALPLSHSSTGPAAPVVYLLHGHGGRSTSWLGCTRLAALADFYGTVLVLPETGRYWLINDAGGRRYEDYLIDEVVAEVGRQFNTRADRAGRAIAGFSMGGATALVHLLRHSDLFSVAGSHSGAFEAPHRSGDPYSELRGEPRMMMPTVLEHERVWGPEGSAVRSEYDPFRLVADADAASLAVYIDVGLDDHPRMLTMNRNMCQALSRNRIPHMYRERPGGHDYAFVDEGLPDLFEFISQRFAAE